MTTTRFFPLWVAILSGIISLLALFVGGSLYIAPGAFMPGIDFSAAGTGFLTRMWAARQVAIGLIIVVSLFRRSAAMLQVSLLAYCLMNLQDVAIGLMKADAGLAGGASFFSLLSAVMIFALRKPAKAENRRVK